MTGENFDLVVIGSGPGGYVCAIRAAQLGLRTAVVERDRIGGRCLNYACIPAKAVLRSADVLQEVRDSGAFGVVFEGAPQLDFATVAKRRDRVVRTLTGGVGGLMKKHNIAVIEGSAAIAPPPAGATGATVTISSAESTQTLEAGSVVLATGSVPKSLFGLQFGGPVLDTTAAWLTTALPASTAVVGAGASGVEIASAYGRFGVAVTLIEALPQILPAEDPEIAELAAKELAKQNIEIVTSAQVTAAAVAGDSAELELNGERREFASVCIAAGRAADISGLGIEQLGLALDQQGLIPVDEYQRTQAAGVYAIGDIVRGPALAHKASEEGVIAAEVAAGHGAAVQPLDLTDIPRATFCHPQVASFGLTDAQATAAGRQIKVGRFPLAAAGAATVYGDRTGLVKIVGDAATGELLGASIVGPKAADMIIELSAARAAQIGFQEIARTVHPHPTVSEAVLEAARDADGWLIHG